MIKKSKFIFLKVFDYFCSMETLSLPIINHSLLFTQTAPYPQSNSGLHVPEIHATRHTPPLFIFKSAFYCIRGLSANLTAKMKSSLTQLAINPITMLSKNSVYIYAAVIRQFLTVKSAYLTFFLRTNPGGINTNNGVSIGYIKPVFVINFYLSNFPIMFVAANKNR